MSVNIQIGEWTRSLSIYINRGTIVMNLEIISGGLNYTGFGLRTKGDRS